MYFFLILYKNQLKKANLKVFLLSTHIGDFFCSVCIRIIDQMSRTAVSKTITSRGIESNKILSHFPLTKKIVFYILILLFKLNGLYETLKCLIMC